MKDSIEISFPDGTKEQYAHGITGYEIARSVLGSAVKGVLVVEVNGVFFDLVRPICMDAKIRFVDYKEDDSLEVIRHDAAHLLAMAVKELFPTVQVVIGPSIKDGFYYDFFKDVPFSEEELGIIESKMHDISSRNVKFEREIWSRDSAIKYFEDIGEVYKAEIVRSIPENEEVSIYRHAGFIDLCRGPHGPSTAHLKHFKLMKVSGAYWRGDSKNAVLQRIYGTAWATKQQLDDYLHMIEEAEKRDHRKLAKELDLFHFQEEARGVPFWHSKGWSIYLIIQNYIRRKLRLFGYEEVNTPVKLDRKLWEDSGHWEKFRDNMFLVTDEDRICALKPMSCPCHVQLFNQKIRSYRDLPLRIAEFGSCYRNEASGALYGLMRVRSMTQDDGHIFCTDEQVVSESLAFYSLLREVYSDFGFHEIHVKFSDRPKIRAGDDDIWDRAEGALREAVRAMGISCIINRGEGAFYGPKLEFVLKDAIGREWQCGTLQVDYILPNRLGASYIASGGEKTTPVMLHRAVLGTLERFIGILIENYAGKFPLWLAPVQVAIVTITNEYDRYAEAVCKQLIELGVRAEAELSSDKVGYKIRTCSNRKIPIIAVIGKEEVERSTLTLRFHGSNEQKTVSIVELIGIIQAENQRYLG